MKTYKFKSYAKVNLYLEVLNKRKDDYHQIITLFERISLADEIQIKPRQDKAINILSNHSGLPKGPTNLAYRAAQLLKENFQINSGVDITIHKRIPLASGLGGGSSNAANVLLALNKIWKLNLNQQKLISYAKKLGCDVPFFLFNASFAIGEERGDRIKKVKAIKKRFWHILIVPKIRISTKKVYNRLDKIFTNKTTKATSCLCGYRPSVAPRYFRLTKPLSDVKILIQALKKGKISLIRPFLFNRMEGAAFNLYPQVRKLKNKFLDLGVGTILMSGSGPAMFGIVSSRKEASVLCKQLSKSGKWYTFIARTS